MKSKMEVPIAFPEAAAMSRRVAVYARVSTTRQAEQDLSLPDQLSQAGAFCLGQRLADL